MNNTKKVIYYDSVYNYHSGYHDEIVLSTQDDYHWVKSGLVNFYEDCVWNDHKMDLSKSLLNHGYFKTKSKDSAIFSPHILLENENPYFIEIELINWLFANTYQMANLEIPKWKIVAFEQLVHKSNLKAILWYSQYSIDNFFKEFCYKYSISNTTKQRVHKISYLVPPVSEQIHRVKGSTNTESNDFIIIFDSKDIYRKGIDFILNIFNKLLINKIDNKFKIHCVGDHMPVFLKRKYPNLETHIYEYGKVSKKKVQRLMTKYPILLFPSRADTYGTVIVEGMNTGCFIISSHGNNVVATSEALENYPDKIVIESKGSNKEFDILDEELFFESIKDLLKNPRHLNDIRLSEFSRESMRKRIKIIMKKVYE